VFNAIFEGAAMPAGVTLGDLSVKALDAIEKSEATLLTKLSTISDGDSVTNIELLEYQMALASNALTATICSSIAKERAETLKGVANKF
jgi:hypothetical protein